MNIITEKDKSQISIQGTPKSKDKLNHSSSLFLKSYNFNRSYFDDLELPKLPSFGTGLQRISENLRNDRKHKKITSNFDEKESWRGVKKRRVNKTIPHFGGFSMPDIHVTPIK